MGLMLLVSACASEPQPLPQPKETYPYGMTEKEWNELSIKDKARIRRDFYFYEKGTISFVDPQMEVEGKKKLFLTTFAVRLRRQNQLSKNKKAAHPSGFLFIRRVAYFLPNGRPADKMRFPLSGFRPRFSGRRRPARMKSGEPVSKSRSRRSLHTRLSDNC